MKSWHWGLIVALILVWLAASKYPSYGSAVLSKVGM